MALSADIGYGINTRLYSSSGFHFPAHLLPSLLAAAEPLLDRVHEWHGQFPVTLIYGEHDFMRPDAGYDIQKRLKDGQADVHVIAGGAHHPYATHEHEFHRAVLHRHHHRKHATAHHQREKGRLF